MPPPSIHTPLHEARKLIRRRWADTALRDAVEQAIGQHLWPEVQNEPCGVMWRCQPSPDNGCTWFLQMSMWCGLKPFLPEFAVDKFFPLNAEKKGLARLSLLTEEGAPVTCDILDWQVCQGRPMNDVEIRTGQTLTGLHGGLFDVAGYKIPRRDMSDWWVARRPASNYYYYYLAHFVCHGILFEAFLEEEDTRENVFLHEVVYPNLERVEREFGVKPLIVQLYPSDQTPEEDFYWFCYPPHVNAWLLNWARENNLPLKPWKRR